MRYIIACISVLLLAACASSPSARERRAAGYISASHPQTKIPPAWTIQAPTLPGWKYFVGESTGSLEKDEALERAWVSAFVRIGMSEFPELTSISTESREGLRTSSHERHFALRLERVNWNGVEEVSQLGSPHIEQDDSTGRYTVFRLLRWKDSDVAASKQQISKIRVHRLPLSPENARRNEQKLVQTIKRMQTLNERASHRNLLLDKVLKDVKCGVTLGDLIDILGAPDRFNPYNNRSVEKEYFWGSYRIERFGPDPRVAAISRTDGLGRRRIICRSR